MDKENIEFPSLSGEEVTIGVHSSGIQLEEGLNTSTKRNLCANCKRNVHCYVKVDKKTKEATVHFTCKFQECECKCSTHYSCRQCGYLHPYGIKCNRQDVELKISPESEEKFQNIMDEWRKETDKNKVKVQEQKKK